MGEISLGLDVIILGIVGALFFAGLVGAGTSYWRWRSAQPGRRRKFEQIALAFPMDLQVASSTSRPVEMPESSEPSTVGSPSSARAAESPGAVRNESVVATGAGGEVSTAASGVAASKPSKSTRTSPSPEPVLEPIPRDVPPKTKQSRPSKAAPAPAQSARASVTPASPTARTAADSALSTPTSVYTVDEMAADNVELVAGRTIVFHRPTPGTMRLLPGRLEVEEGEDSPAEIRFVDVPGATPEVTFGRRRGEPFRHVQLRSLTVSREHARLAREGKNWVISNLSQTNPIVVNGDTLDADDQRRVLHDGDRIEMGEVVFRYRGV